MRIPFALAAAALIALLSVGCASSDDDHGHMATSRSSATPVNTHCPMMMDHAVDPAVTVAFEGQTVGFCCEGCVAKWNELSEADRRAKLMR